MTEDNDNLVRVSSIITLKDIVTFVSLAVTITLAWGLLGTRLTVAEKELVFQTKIIEKHEKSIEAIKSKQEQLELRIRDNEDAIQSLWTNKRKNP